MSALRFSLQRQQRIIAVCLRPATAAGQSYSDDRRRFYTSAPACSLCPSSPQWTTSLPAAQLWLQPHRDFSVNSSPNRAGKSDSKASAAISEADIFGDASNLGLFAKFKLMYKKYWYVLLPVHVVTSIGWLGAFYYLSKSGVDIPALLEHIHLSENIIQKVKGSDMGHVALAYVLYKVTTPLRYAVTLGGTTVSIKYLVHHGYIKPIPSKQEIMLMYEQKKADRAAAKAEIAEKKAENLRRDNEEK